VVGCGPVARHLQRGAREPRRRCACRAVPECIVITNGARQALHLALRLLSERGVRRVAVEDPGWVLQRLAAADAGLEAIPVLVDELGMRAHELADLGVQAAILTPAHSFRPASRLRRRAAPHCWIGRGRPTR